METVANGHTFMSPEQSYAVTESALSTLTLEEINAAAAELCAHITGLKDGEACTPKSAAGPDAAIDDDRLCEAVRAACVADVVPVEDVVVPQAGGGACTACPSPCANSCRRPTPRRRRPSPGASSPRRSRRPST